MATARKTVLITGCSPGGIGYEIAKQMHEKELGFRVLATARSIESIQTLSSLGIQSLSLELNNVDSIAGLLREVEKITNGRLDMLINNAGRNYTVPALDVDFDDVNDVLQTNTVAVMRMCQTFAPLLIAAKGTIVQIGSAAALIRHSIDHILSLVRTYTSETFNPSLMYIPTGVYNASKAAIHAYSNTLRVELAPFGVKVTIVVSGRVQSRLSRIKRTLKPDSLYKPMEEEYARRVEHSQGDATPADQFAATIVPQLLLAKPPLWVWEGKQSWTVWFLDGFVPRSRVHSIFLGLFDFSGLK
ncbi:hypothetical protein N7478_012077 [Penicillium angulare]|uniref:uncharacterized protein n=1 Tax=Penicillium angulare TaxID=116970 RepID=UPI00253FBC48|nr:uncharacterized protein N7478_012077 [Penicillium angulare]KAJ5260472.1 hypothetical protein N7478_012077 [Penicillium angulare]